ncbi:unnamed protein product [Vicia faba]|uniref:Uncharacterized protein n=1 Tax=Vicia faba TaxID=3906 RepID=A0AAV1A1S7_VICFA|nr:unnamed protein product [Vicia faba]
MEFNPIDQDVNKFKVSDDVGDRQFDSNHGQRSYGYNYAVEDVLGNNSAVPGDGREANASSEEVVEYGQKNAANSNKPEISSDFVPDPQPIQQTSSFRFQFTISAQASIESQLHRSISSQNIILDSNLNLLQAPSPTQHNRGSIDSFAFSQASASLIPSSFYNSDTLQYNSSSSNFQQPFIPFSFEHSSLLFLFAFRTFQNFQRTENRERREHHQRHHPFNSLSLHASASFQSTPSQHIMQRRFPLFLLGLFFSQPNLSVTGQRVWA